MEVAEKLRELVPCAEMTRFGKNGSDATAGAIRLARAHTRRDHVLVCGYHGWQDWYIGSTARNRGVPQAVRELTHTVQYNDLDSVEDHFKRFPDQIAAVILEPMNVTAPQPGYLQGLRQITERNGSLLIFDETITGFRFAAGGAQSLFGVVPDLATFGKGLANGYPVSAVCGKAKFMKLMEEIFFSFTFGGETLSLAAALATMTKIQKTPVIETLYRQGEKVLKGVEGLIAKHGIGHILSIAGNPTWTFLMFKDVGGYTQWQTKTLFLQEVFQRGLLVIGTHNMSYAHSDAEVQHLLSVYDEVFPVLRAAVDDKGLDRLLLTKPLESLFKLR
jgi:glutamate-1-semialdehyde 2,1-aminomutase